MKDIKDKRWLTPDDFKNEFKFDLKKQSKLRMRTSKSRLPYSKIGRSIFYDRHEINAWLKKHEICKP